MKRITSLIMIFLISFALISCDNKTIDIPNKPDNISELTWLKGISALKMVDDNVSNKKLLSKDKDINSIDSFVIYYGKNLIEMPDGETEFCQGILNILTEYTYYNEYLRIEEKEQANKKSDLVYQKIEELYKKYK
jgi:hypothetical protein